MEAPETLISPNILEVVAEEAANTPPGAIAEVGVYKGGSAFIIAQRNPDRAMYLYDTFAGIPEKTAGLDGHEIGEFTNKDVASVRAAIPHAIICQGVFPETFVPVPYAFVHVDCDQYKSIKACIETFAPYMVPGGKMWFDDYSCLEGATRAVEESGRPFEKPSGKAMMRF